ncbi:MAG: hypothetical protein CSA20_04170 [Deltaproteobacteria bacterium]|nr:MAG: hypothetical protein CSA20_04170 [Deltaproteobacteria bacterium]
MTPPELMKYPGYGYSVKNVRFIDTGKTGGTSCLSWRFFSRPRGVYLQGRFLKAEEGIREQVPQL